VEAHGAVPKEQASDLPVSYIVRIYRSQPPEAMAGTVEVPELAEQVSFASFEELKSILALDRSPSGRQGSDSAQRRRQR
jgi:hypothetical protein